MHQLKLSKGNASKRNENKGFRVLGGRGVDGGDEEEVKERVWMVCSWVLGVDLEWKGRTAVDPERLGVLLKEATGRRLGLDGVVMTRVG